MAKVAPVVRRRGAAVVQGNGCPADSSSVTWAQPVAGAARVSDVKGRRLWRMRRLHQFVDAELWPAEDDSVELRYLLNGEPTFRRTWVSRDDAVRAAAAKRAELERDGWMFHW